MLIPSPHRCCRPHVSAPRPQSNHPRRAPAAHQLLDAALFLRAGLLEVGGARLEPLDRGLEVLALGEPVGGETALVGVQLLQLLLGLGQLPPRQQPAAPRGRRLHGGVGVG